MTIDPQADHDRQACARHLLQHPLTCGEQHPDMFRLIRRHEQDLDRWFTQRLGYRLHVSSDTARLFKSTSVAERRPLMTATTAPRPFAQREYVLLSLVLAAVASGPQVISLRDLIDRVRTAAADAEVDLSDEPAERRALVTALQWMISKGLASELHDRVEHYVADSSADAVLKVRPDRVALLPLNALTRAADADALLDRPERVNASRQWMRARLTEDPVVYREDLDGAEWSELRRRLGEEADMLSEMFAMVLEIRAEGVAAVDPSGQLTDRPMPATGTVGHAALLLLDRLTRDNPARPEGAAPTTDDDQTATAEIVVSTERVVELLRELAERNRHWSKLAAEPRKLAAAVLSLLADHRLIDTDDGFVRVLPMAHRFAVVEHRDDVAPADDLGVDQGQLW